MPGRVVVYYVLCLCLFFGDAHEEVMRFLVAGLHFTGEWQKDWHVPTTGAISQARQRLGRRHCSCCSSGSQFPARSGAPEAPGSFAQADGD